MENNSLTNTTNNSPFDSIRKYDENGTEFWKARELQKMMGYRRWENFGGSKEDRLSVVDKARLACTNSGNNTENHFRQTANLVKRSHGGGSSQD